MVNRWSLKLNVNKCKTAFYGRDINYEYKITNIISHQQSWKERYIIHERFRCGI